MSVTDKGWRAGRAWPALAATAGLGLIAVLSMLSMPAMAADKANHDALIGAWVRPDGGYVILVKSVGPDGRLQAMYFNPNPLPFAQAQVSREGGKLRAFFELQAGGYAGSTYTLTYDPAADRLTGIYYQAVAKQSFDVVFSRK